jgi:hypothetical protein
MPEWIERVTTFMQYLGGHHGAYDGGRQHHLTLPELGALVVVAGREAGFKIKTEVAVHTGLNAPRIDCAWFIGNAVQPVVVWEFDARDVRLSQLTGTTDKPGPFGKLAMFPAATKIQALYTIRGGIKADGHALQQGFQPPDGIQVHTDEALMQGQIIQIAEGARLLA